MSSISFIYGGNTGNITVNALDGVGTVVDSFFQASTDDGEPAGPTSLSGSGIRSLSWQDSSGSFAILDNLTIVPESTTASVPFEFSPTTGLVLSLGLFGIHYKWKKKQQQKIEL